MKPIFILIIFLTLPKILLSQTHLYPMELKSIILNQNTLTKFIKTDFVIFKTDRRELFEINHPMEGFKFNRIIQTPVKFNFMNLPVDEIYGYYEYPDQISLYMLIQINTSAEMDNFVSELGIPENITTKDYKTGDFEIAMWRKNDLEVCILHNFETPVSTNKRIVIVHHLRNHDFINWDPI